MVFVTKFDGSKQPFDRNKVMNTCLKLGATQEQAEKVVKNIEKNLYEGIPTKKILKMVFVYLERLKPEIKYQRDLREAISKLRPKPDFELFVALLLKEFGYSVISNQIIAGDCVDHEIDAIAAKNGQNIFVEVKHHLQPHTYTGVDVFLEVYARLEDLRKGFEKGKNNFNFSKALMVCNTKFSDHALRYAKCKGIDYIGWKAPPEAGLEKMVEEKKLYPITLLKGLDSEIVEKLLSNGIITLKQFVECDVEMMSKKINIGKRKLKFWVNVAREKIFKSQL